MKISAGKVVIPIRAAPQARPIRTELRIRSLPWFWWSLLSFFFFFLFLSDVFSFLVFFHDRRCAADVFLEYEGRGDRFKKSLRVGQVTGHGLENLASRRLGELCWTFSSGLQLDVYLGWPCCIVEIELPYGAVSSNDSVSVLQSFRVAYLCIPTLYIDIIHPWIRCTTSTTHFIMHSWIALVSHIIWDIRFCTQQVPDPAPPPYSFLLSIWRWPWERPTQTWSVDKSHCEDGDRSLQISCIGASCPLFVCLSPKFDRILFRSGYFFLFAVYWNIRTSGRVDFFF